MVEMNLEVKENTITCIQYLLKPNILLIQQKEN